MNNTFGTLKCICFKPLTFYHTKCKHYYNKPQMFVNKTMKEEKFQYIAVACILIKLLKERERYIKVLILN